MSTPEPHIKGEAMRQFAGWHLSRFGPERIAKFVSELPPDVRGIFDVHDPHLGLVSSTWYPASAFHALIDHMLRDYTPEQKRTFSREAARVAIDASLRGVYKLLFEAIMSPDRYMNRAQKLFSRFYDSGVIAKTKSGPTSHLTRITGWTSHHPIFCDVMLYTSELVYPRLGCKNVVAERISCIATGGDACSYEVRWT